VFQHVSVPQLDIDDIMQCIRSSVIRAVTEEDVRVWVSKCIEEKILKPLGIQQTAGRYEYTLVSGARADALYGHVIVEYKAPGKLSSASDIQRAREQVIKYIMEEAGKKSEWSRYLGVIISDRIAFVRYDHRNDTWVLRGPYDIRREVVVKLVEALRGLRRRRLDVDSLIEGFGPKSEIAGETIKLLYNKLKASSSSRTRMLFEDWMRLFRQATGYDPERLKELPALAKEYGLTGGVDYNALIFSVHTYYALIMKLLAAEIAYLYGGGRFYRSYIAELDDAYSRGGVEGIKDALRDLEGGGIFKRLLNIENFLEGDYFSWYVDELDERLAGAIAKIARMLSEYEVATPQLEPEFARDLLKRLYQNLVPRDLRRGLGEFYTPDWLANLVLNEVGLSLDDLHRMGKEDPLKPLRMRVLDPACGSGTFLILYISRLRRYAEEHYQTDQLLNYVLDNVVGYDLNPLAVLTARTNYLLAIADLLGYARGKVEIPVYLADSIMIESGPPLAEDVYILRTVVGEFQIPKDVVSKGLLPEVLAEITQALRNRYRVEDFRERIKYRFKEIKEDVDVLAGLYKVLLKLEEEGKDEVWISVLRNAFAPILKGEFDYVVGNPPWINWENLPEGYRETSKELWKKYGLAEIKGKTGLGKVKRDIAMLFLARCFDLYLREGGRLGFLIPFTIFKTQAGAGFRSFLAKRTRIHVIHDLVTLYPFEEAVNRTAAIFVEKAYNLSDNRSNKVYENNISGVKHIIWVNTLKERIPTDMSLEEVLRKTKRFEAVMIPIMLSDPASPWMQVTSQTVKAIRRLISGSQYYKAHAGVYVGLNQVYYVKILEKLPDARLKITNPPEPGQKKKVRQMEAVVEPDLVYPLIRGRDVKRWYVYHKDRYIILPVDSQGNIIGHRDMKIKYPTAYSYFFVNFFRELVNRGGEPYKSKLEPYRKLSLEIAEKSAPPFYWIFNVKPSLAPYKVVWKRIAGAITGKAVEFACAVVEPLLTDFASSKPVIPDDGTILIEFDDKNEAYYVAGFLNSTLIRAIVASYTYELRQETHIADIIKIPRYDSGNELHNKISELSKRAHDFAKEIYEKNRKDLENELKKVEEEIDVAVAELLGMSKAELEEFKRLLAILSGKIPEEEEIPIPEKLVVNVLNTSLQPDVESYIEVDVVNPSGEEIAFTYELPWGSGSFSIVEGRYKIPTPPLKPGRYTGALRWAWRGEESSLDIVIEVSEPVGPRRRRSLLDPR